MDSALVIALIYTWLCLAKTTCFTTFEMKQNPEYFPQQISQPRNISVAKIDGDLILGGLFSLHRQHFDKECGVYTSPRNIIRVEAMLYAIDEINRNNTILPNITLGAEIRDDCYSSTIALEESLNFVLNAFGQAGNRCTADRERPPVMGVVGTVSSQTAIAVASLLRLFRLPQISYGATSPDLSNRDEYKYFTRTVPSDECQAEALIDVIRQLGWSAVFLISSSGNYGERIREAFVRLTENRRICIVDELTIGNPEEEGSKPETKLAKEIGGFLLKIKKRTSVRGVVLLTESFHTHSVLKSVNDTDIGPNRFDWLGSDTWGVGQPLDDVEDIADGAITVALHTPCKNNLKHFYDYFRGLKPTKNPRNPWFDMFWERYFHCAISQNSTRNYLPECNWTKSYSYNHEIWSDDKTPYVFDSVYAFAHSLDALLKTTNSSLPLRERLEELSRNEENLLKYLLETRFTGKSGEVSFDEMGNGKPKYDIMSYKNHKYETIAVWKEGKFIPRTIPWFEKRKNMGNSSSTCGEECGIGKGQVSRPEDPPCCWNCKVCPPEAYVDDQYQCQSCGKDMRPYKNLTGCEPLPQEGPRLFVIIILTIWGCLGLICTTFVAFTMYRFYSTPLIMASGRELMLLLLSGIALSYLLGFALLGEPSVRRCMFQRFGSGVFLAICYSAVFVKTNRIARIFRGQHRPAFITPGPQVVITAVLVSIQVGISLIASIFGTTSEVSNYYHQDHFHKICRTSGTEYVVSISYNVVLLLLCTGYAFLTRKLPANFNEAKLVGITMYTTCVQWICFLPLFYGTAPVYQTSVLLMNACFSATVLLVGMFGQKVYVVWFRPERNTRSASNPRGRIQSTTSQSQHSSSHMDDLVNGNYQSQKGEEFKRCLEHSHYKK